MRETRPRLWIAAACLGATLLTACAPESPYSSANVAVDEPRGSDRQAVPEVPAPSFDQPEQAMPEHGRVAWLNTPENNAILQGNIANGWSGRLTITTGPGVETYFIKLVSTYPTHGDVLGVTVAADATVVVDVPLDGSSDETIYELFYGAGSRWYGDEHAFGPEGSYARADDEFAFSEGTWWEVELVLTPGGNLGMSGLDYEDF